jgi:hypothetical protein
MAVTAATAAIMVATTAATVAATTARTTTTRGVKSFRGKGHFRRSAGVWDRHYGCRI